MTLRKDFWGRTLLLGQQRLLRQSRHAARLLGSTRGTLLSIRRRNQHAANNLTPTTDNAIPMPAAIFTIRQNENLHSFKHRIQLASSSKQPS